MQCQIIVEEIDSSNEISTSLSVACGILVTLMDETVPVNTMKTSNSKKKINPVKIEPKTYGLLKSRCASTRMIRL